MSQDNQEQQNNQSPEYHEQRHRKQVKSAFSNYEKDIKEEWNLQKADINPFYKANHERKYMMIEEGIKHNQQFLNKVLEYINSVEEEDNFVPLQQTQINNRSKIKTTVKQFFRQWSSETPQMIDYQRIVKQCQKYLKAKDNILVPGCGLGRLVFELVRGGFGAEGNQVTYFMLYCSNFIINCSSAKEEFKIFPFISSSDYYYDEEDSFRSIKVPDVVASEELDEEPQFAIVGGQFTEVYKERPESFEGVATCFFLDTANNIFDYIDTIWHTLKNGGTWVNFGPLLYHYHEMTSEVSVEVSWEVMKEYIQHKFDIIESEMIETTYLHDPKSQMKVVYNCISFVCHKKDITKSEGKEEKKKE